MKIFITDSDHIATLDGQAIICSCVCFSLFWNLKLGAIKSQFLVLYPFVLYRYSVYT